VNRKLLSLKRKKLPPLKKGRRYLRGQPGYSGTPRLTSGEASVPSPGVQEKRRWQSSDVLDAPLQLEATLGLLRSYTLLEALRQAEKNHSQIEGTSLPESVEKAEYLEKEGVDLGKYVGFGVSLQDPEPLEVIDPVGASGDTSGDPLDVIDVWDTDSFLF